MIRIFHPPEIGFIYATCQVLRVKTETIIAAPLVSDFNSVPVVEALTVGLSGTCSPIFESDRLLRVIVALYGDFACHNVCVLSSLVTSGAGCVLFVLLIILS